MAEKSLTNKQRVFTAEYLKDFNATRAAKAAGYSEATAYSQGQRLLKNVEIRQAVDDLVNMKVDEVKSRLADIARGDIAELMDITTSGFTFKLLIKNENGELIVNPKTRLIRKIKQKVTTFIAKKESDEDREIIETEFELYSAHEALRDIGKIHGLFIDRAEISGPDGSAVNINVKYA